jgi:hypothetical protein
MIQQLLIAALFFGSAFYLIRGVYKSFQTKSGCSTGCGKCNAVDFAKIEQQIKEKKF